MQLPYNSEHPLQHIMQAVVNRFSRVKNWILEILENFADFKQEFKIEPIPKLGYWKVRGLAAGIRY